MSKDKQPPRNHRCEDWSQNGMGPPPFCSNGIFNNLSIAIIAVNADAEVIYWNDAAQRLFGWTFEEVKGRFLPILPEEERSEFQQLFSEELNGRSRLTLRCQRKNKNGKLIDVVLSTSPLQDQSGRIYGSIGFFVDDSEKAMLEEDLEKTFHLLEAVFSSMDQAVFVVQPETRTIRFANRAAEKIFGYLPNELIGQNTRILHKDQAAYEAWGPQSGQALTLEGKYHVETQMRRKSGELFWAEITITPIDLKTGWFSGVISVIRDISERKQAYTTLQEREATLQAIFDTSQSGIIMVDVHGRITFANHRMAEMLGCSLEALTDSFYNSHIHPDEKPIASGLMRKVIAGELDKVSLERRYIRADGSSFWGYLTGKRLENVDGRFQSLIGVISDISEIKQKEMQLGEQRNLLRSFIDHIPMGVFWKDRNSVFQGCNKQFAVIAGVAAPEEVIGKTDFDLPWTKAESDYLRQCDRKVMSRDQPLFDFEKTLHLVDGRQATFLISKVPLHDAADKTSGMLGIYTDITDRRQMEDELRSKNLELEHFLYTVSHDLKSPLVTLKTFLGMFEQNLNQGDTEQIKGDLHYMHNAADKMELLLRDLLEISRVGRVIATPERFSFREGVEEALDTLAGDITDKKVEIAFHDVPIIFEGDRTRLVQVWENLLGNAIKYMGGQTAPRIDVGAQLHDGERIFSVCDNGMGIAPRFHDKIFNLFEKLDPHSEGTGLGLALTKRVVELYDGRLWVEANPSGQGSCFRFTLPGALVAAGPAAEDQS